MFYGPAGGGKTTTLTQLHKLLRPEVRGQIVSVNTGTDRTLFFDFYPPPPPLLGAPVHAQVFAGSGSVQNESTRRALLAGCDGVLFVWDSLHGREADCTTSLEELRACLLELGTRLQDVPLLVAWNKRDLPDAVPVSELENLLGLRRLQTVPMVAITGQGVFEAFRQLATESLTCALRKRPELSQSGGIPRREMSIGNDMMTARRMLAAQEAESSLVRLLDQHVLDEPLRLDESALAKAEPGKSQDVVPVSLMSTPSLPRHEQSHDAVPPVRSEVGLPLEEQPRFSAGRTPNAAPDTGTFSGRFRTPKASSLDKTMPGLRLTQRSKPPTAPQPPKMETSVREQGLSVVLEASPYRAHVQEIERMVQSAQFVHAVRRAQHLFSLLPLGDSTREPQEGPAYRALLLGLPAARYQRFRQISAVAERGQATVEDAWFALFFVVDALLRIETLQSRMG